MISILIPTLNRPEFLYRALKYYRAAGFDGVISIGDSSDDVNSAKNMDAINRVTDGLRVDYQYYSKDKYHIGLVVKDLIDRAETSYVALCCDDDFLNVNGVKKCASFLDGNPDYVSARGIRITFMLSNLDSVYGKIDNLLYVPSLDLESESAADRWATYMRCNTATAYNVHRKVTFQKMWQRIEEFFTHDLKHEIYPCSVTCLLGKTKNIDVLYNVVQHHRGSLSFSGKIRIYDAIVSEGWSSDVRHFCNYVCDELKMRDKLSEEEARSFFYKEFENYLLSQFLYYTGLDNKNINIDRITNLAMKIRTSIRKRPYLSAFLRYLSQRKLDAANLYNHPHAQPVALASMTGRSSPYREDFSTIVSILAKQGSRGDRDPVS